MCIYEQFQVPQSAAHKAQNGVFAESNECRSVYGVVTLHSNNQATHDIMAAFHGPLKQADCRILRLQSQGACAGVGDWCFYATYVVATSLR